jgi:hypothetical protein
VRVSCEVRASSTYTKSKAIPVTVAVESLSMFPVKYEHHPHIKE